MKEGMTMIVKTVARLLFPIMFLFGIYVIIHGHLTPGGGFPGGVIVASAVAMLLLSYGMDKTKEEIGEIQTEISESFGALILVGLGIIGIIFVGGFLQEVLPLGTVGELFSGGNLPILNIGVGIKVGAGLTSILYAMMALGRDNK